MKKYLLRALAVDAAIVVLFLLLVLFSYRGRCTLLLGGSYDCTFSTYLAQDVPIILLFFGWIPALFLIVPPIAAVYLWRKRAG